MSPSPYILPPGTPVENPYPRQKPPIDPFPNYKGPKTGGIYQPTPQPSPGPPTRGGGLEDLHIKLAETQARCKAGDPVACGRAKFLRVQVDDAQERHEKSQPRMGGLMGMHRGR